MNKPQTYTITIPADKVDHILSALMHACENAEHFGSECIEDDPEIRDSWNADDAILGELLGMISAARETEGGAE